MRLRPMTDARVHTLSRGPLSSFCGAWNLRTMTPEAGGVYDPHLFGLPDELHEQRNWGHIELAVGVVHPWFRPLLAEMLGFDERQLNDVVAHRAGWFREEWGDWEEGEFMPRDEDDDDDEILDDDEIPILTGPTGLADALEQVELDEPHRQLLDAWAVCPSDLLVRALPVLPPRWPRPHRRARIPARHMA